MKKVILFSLTIFMATFIIAQEATPKNALQVGVTIGQIQQDFGFGLNLTSLFFIKQKVAFRVRGNFAFTEHLDPSAQIVWTPYSNLTLGVVGIAGRIGNNINISMAKAVCSFCFQIAIFRVKPQKLAAMDCLALNLFLIA